MIRTRIVFSKTGRAAYISHLDLIRTFQRAFRRAEIEIKFSEGFNPHPNIYFAVPLPLGHESTCEIMDFELLSEISHEEIARRLNGALPEGIEIGRAYDAKRNAGDITYISYEIVMEYDRGAGEEYAGQLNDLFAGGPLMVIKESKKGEKEFDVMTAVKEISFSIQDKSKILAAALLRSKDPYLNPELLIKAVTSNINEAAPDFVRYKRTAMLDEMLCIFE